MPQAKANPICRTTPVLTFAADYRSSHRVKRTLFLLTTGLLFAACTFAAKPPNVVLISGNWKLILPHKTNTNATEPELYNLTKDPHETQNLAKTNPQQAKRLAKQLNELLPES